MSQRTALPKKKLRKRPKRPTAGILKKEDRKEERESKKISIKEMVNQALVDLNSRKGTSFYAIKKYIEDKYKVDVKQLNNFIKKYLKTSVERGTIVQVKEEERESKKISTKEMVNQALVDLNSRKGTSFYAIKKYIEDKYKVDVKQLNNFIKKYLKTSVERGTIVQVKEEERESKKISTKEMVNQALVDLKSRKGTSLYAIKKYIQDKFEVDVKKLNNFIKKYLKTSVELGTIVQVKGVGANGSFKLAPGQGKSEKKKKPAKKTRETSKTEKPTTKHVKEVESNEFMAAKKAEKVEMLNNKEVDKKDSDAKKKSRGKKRKLSKPKWQKLCRLPQKKSNMDEKKKALVRS